MHLPSPRGQLSRLRPIVLFLLFCFLFCSPWPVPRLDAKKTRMRADADREDCTPAASPPRLVFPTRGAGSRGKESTSTLEFRGRGGRALGFSSYGGTWNRASVLSAHYTEFSSFINRGWGSSFGYAGMAAFCSFDVVCRDLLLHVHEGSSYNIHVSSIGREFL